PTETKKRRNNELLAIQGQISSEIHQSCVGKVMPVFVESISTRERKTRERSQAGGLVQLGWEGASSTPTAVAEDVQTVTQLTGRTDGDLIVCFDGDESM